MRSARRLLLIFSVTVLVPCLILGVFGLTAFTRERDAERQVRQRFDEFAIKIGRRLELELRNWQQAADELAGSDSNEPARWPTLVQDAIAQPGFGVVLMGRRDNLRAFPSGFLLYDLTAEPEGESSELFNEAESFELRTKQYDKAIALYRQLTASTVADERVRALHLLGRTLVKVGQTEEALRTFRMLEKERPVRIGSVPSDLLALGQIALLEEQTNRTDDAMHLYRGLVGGRWRLERVIYEAYSEDVRAWIPNTAETLELKAEEEQKRKQSLAVERFLDSPQPFYIEDGAATLTFWRSEPFAAIILSPSHVRSHVLPATGAEDLDVTLSVSGPPYGELVGTYALQDKRYPLQLQVRPRNAATLFAGLARQRNFYLAMMVVLVGLLGFGGYFTIQTLKSEFAVAQMKSDFVSTVSHEFRSPLAGINQLVEMLRDRRVRSESQRQEYYEMIVTETQRLRRLVENVLDFARMEDGRKQYRFERVDTASWLLEIAADFQGQVAGRGFAIETRIPTELPSIAGDRETLTTAVHNLLDNAVKYSLNSRTVWLAAQSRGDALSISVCDRGIGIREEDRPRIFEKFFRGGGDVTRQVKGVGLGLNLVQHIVAAHGGTIDVDSKEGEGSTFTIHLNAERRPA